jgi:hypothetical protein
MPPLLLFISILTSFLAIGWLFTLLYPVLPFKLGYIKAVVFGLFLLLIFYFGIGTDENLASTWQNLMIGRLVYYTGMPLLIGLFFDSSTASNESANSPGNGEQVSDGRLSAKAIATSLQDIRTLLSTFGSIATLLAPTIYAYFTHEKLLINYFDLLQIMVSLAAK